MSHMFVYWTLNTGDVSRFQIKTKDKHMDLIYTYHFVIIGTGTVIIEFRQRGCYPFNFLYFLIPFFCYKILYELLSVFLPNVLYCFLICFYELVRDFSLENYTYFIVIVSRAVWMSPVLGRLSVT
jgi:hypothetical protein